MTPRSDDQHEQYELRAGSYRAAVVQRGGGLRALSVDGRPLVDGYGGGERPEGGRGQLLVPWPNRVDRGRYEFDGEQHQLDLTEPDRDCAIHGLVRSGAWRLVEHTDTALTLAYELREARGYPYPLDLRVDYALDADAGLTVRLTARNTGTTPAPYGNGAHPYLTVGTQTIDECQLVVPAAVGLRTDERGLPTGRAPVDGTALDFRTARRIGATWIDDPFTDLVRDDAGRAHVVLRDPASGASTSLWLDHTCRWVQVFTGDTLGAQVRQGLAVEPMTCPPNAFVTGADVVVLLPGEQHTTSWGITGSS